MPVMPGQNYDPHPLKEDGPHTARWLRRMLERRCLIVILMYLFPTLVSGQYRFDSWTTENGLPQNTVWSISQTPDGYIWLATSDGLVRFDGIKFKIFNKSNSPNFPSNRLRHLVADRSGALWITPENAGIVQLKDGVFTHFTTENGLPWTYAVYAQNDTDGSLLIHTTQGLIRTRDGANFEIARRGDAIAYQFAVSSTGSRWEISIDGITETRNGLEDQHYPLPFNAVRAPADPTYNFNWGVSMFAEGDDELWVAAAGKLFHYFGGRLTVLDASNGLPLSRVQTIGRDSDGNLWIGTESDGACQLSDSSFTCFTTANGLSSNNVTQVFVDREKTLWLATDNAGLNRVTRQSIASFSKNAGLIATNVYPIMQDRSGGIWIGSFGALARFAEGKTKNILRGDGLTFDYVQALLEDRDGTIWVGSIGALTRLHEGKFEDFTDILGVMKGRENFWDIHQTPDGTLWFGTDSGLYRYFENKVTRFSVADGLPGNEVKVIYESRNGSLWIGTTAGLAIISDGNVTQLTEKDGLASNFVRTVYEDDAGIWVGTYDGGLSLYRDGRFARKITAESGLFSNGVFAILPDDRGNFWMSSNQGIFRVSRNELIDFADGTASSVTSAAFGRSDGMLSTECNGGRQPAGIRAKDGKLWFPTQNGVAIVDPNAVPINPLPPPVVIEDVFIQQKQAVLSGNTLHVPPGVGDVQINYTGLSFVKPEQMRFRYKLEGVDENWTDVGNRRTAYYPYLPPGNYTFRVMTANSDNVWSEHSADIDIVVIPPYYRRWWFVMLAALFIGGLALTYYKRRVGMSEKARLAQEEFSRRLINAHETERRRIAAELHDSLGQSLAIIKNQAVFGAQKAVGHENTRTQFEQISRQSASAITEVREIAYNLRPYLLDRLGLTKAVRSMLAKIAEIGALEIDGEIDDIDGAFSPETEISIYRVLQEGLNNVLKHSEATRASVSIIKGDRLVSILIKDNGRGFIVRRPAAEPEAEKPGFGLLGIAERVKMIGGTHVIESEPGRGTSITIRVPLSSERN